MTSHYCELTNDALLHIEGPDTLTFLQGQTTCDTQQVSSQLSVPGVYCTPQGRVVCDFLLTQLHENAFALRMRNSITDEAAAVFGKYIVFSKADIVTPDAPFRIFGIWGDGAREALEQALGSAPDGQFKACEIESGTLVQVDTHGSRFELYCPASAAQDLEARLAAAATLSDQIDWEAQQIRAGEARIEAATSGEFVPQSLNYDITGWINFTKGCYTGQEVVARLHYRGTPKRRAFVASIANTADHSIGPGSTLVTSDGRNAGTVVNSVPQGDKQLLLVSATVEGFADGLRAADDSQLVTEPQPYPIAEAEDAG